MRSAKDTFESKCHTFIFEGVPITTSRIDDLLIELWKRTKIKKGMRIHLCNTFTLVMADSNEFLKECLIDADINLADGSPLAWQSRDFSLNSPIRGQDLFEEVMNSNLFTGTRHLAIFSNWQNDKLIIRELRSRYPGINWMEPVVVDVRAEVDASILKEVSRKISLTQPSVVWIGTGTPSQDFLVNRLFELDNRPLYIPVGAVLTNITENILTVPRFIKNSGIEWLFRLAREPKRLWRRYLKCLIFWLIRWDYLVLGITRKIKQRKS